MKAPTPYGSNRDSDDRQLLNGVEMGSGRGGDDCSRAERNRYRITSRIPGRLGCIADEGGNSQPILGHRH